MPHKQTIRCPTVLIFPLESDNNRKQLLIYLPNKTIALREKAILPEVHQATCEKKIKINKKPLHRDQNFPVPCKRVLENDFPAQSKRYEGDRRAGM